MPILDFERLKKHPIVIAATIAITSASSTGVVLYKVVVEDLRDKKAELISELQLTKQRVSSLEASVAVYDGQCALKLQAQSKESQERCDKQLQVATESSKQLASSNEKLIDEVRHKETALMTVTTRLNNQQVSLTQFQQLKADEKTLSGKIAALHFKHKELSREFGYNQAECEAKGFSSGNICEHASMNKAELESIERELESLKLELSQIQQQIVQVTTHN